MIRLDVLGGGSPGPYRTAPTVTPQERHDGWINVLTGIGTLSRDKTRQNAFESVIVRREEAEALWRSDDIAARIVETIPREMMREGYTVKIESEDKGLGDDPEEKALGLDPDIMPGEQKGALGEDPEDPNAPEDETQSEDPEEGDAGRGPATSAEDPEEGAAQSESQPDDPARSDPRGEKPGEEPAESGAEEASPSPGSPDAPAPEDPKRKKKPAFKKDGFGGGFGGKPGGPPGVKPFGGGGGFGAPTPPAKPPGEIRRPDDDARKQSEEAAAYAKRLQADPKIRTCLERRRAFGGAGLLVGADDGLALDQPLNETAIKTIKWLLPLTGRELVAHKYYSDPEQANYGEVELYRLQPENPFLGGPGAITTAEQTRGPDKSVAGVNAFDKLIHESRIIKFQGIVVSANQLRGNEFPSWGDNVFTRCAKVLGDFGITWAAAAIMLHDFAQAVFKIKGLSQLVATNRADVVVQRAQLLDMNRSVSRSLLIDAEEEFERKTTTLTGYPEMLDRFATRLAMAAETPVAFLTGEAPAGLNATGDSTIRMFYDKLAATQKTDLQPQLERLFKLIFLAKDGPTKGKEPKNWTIEFKPLWQLTALEEADLRLKVAQADGLWIDKGVLTPEEVAASRFGGDSFSTETTIDLEGRAAAAVEHEAKQAEFDKQNAEHVKAGTKALKEGKLPGPTPPPGTTGPGSAPPFGGKPGAPGDEKPAKKNPFSK